MNHKASPIKTRVTQLFDIEYPILAAPMFLVSNESMVCAASNAGGLGTFPAMNFRPIENYRQAIRDIKKQTTKPFGINIIVQKKNKLQDQHLDIALEEGVPLIITSLGSPKTIIERTRATNTKVFCDVVGLTHAKKVADLGANGLIAVGSGAGGHAGETSLFALLPYLKKYIDLPLIAAGSISDGKGLAAALALGADAVYMGTRMIATHESPVSEEYKQAILQAGTEDIINTDRVDGFDGNFIKTPLLEKLLQPNVVDNVLSQSPRIKRWISLLRAAKVMFGNENQKVSYKNIFSAGHGVGSIDKLLTIEEVLQNTMQQYHELKKSLP
jgi:nitronate monooxygenase